MIETPAETLVDVEDSDKGPVVIQRFFSSNESAYLEFDSRFLREAFTIEAQTKEAINQNYNRF